MNWEYRVLRTVDKETGKDRFGLHEVYLRPDGSIEGLTTEPVEPVGETPEQLREDLEMMLAALDKQTLDGVVPLRRGMLNPYKKPRPDPALLPPVTDEDGGAAT